jgi:hypothetical protein
MKFLFLLPFVFVVGVVGALAFSTPSSSSSSSSSSTQSGTSTRRRFAASVVGGSSSIVVPWIVACTSPILLVAAPALGVVVSQQDTDKRNIVNGYQRLTYLVDNWEAETTVCGVSDNPYTSDKGCERSPVKVMEYLGYKDISDPLFKADKTIRRLQGLVPADRLSEFVDAVERWTEAADAANGMAYVSSWGEANPGGGKDRVALYIQRSRQCVLDARESLESVIDILQLQKPNSKNQNSL